MSDYFGNLFPRFWPLNVISSLVCSVQGFVSGDSVISIVSNFSSCHFGADPAEASFNLGAPDGFVIHSNFGALDGVFRVLNLGGKLKNAIAVGLDLIVRTFFKSSST